MQTNQIERKLIAERDRLQQQITRIEADFAEPLDDDLDDQAIEREDDDLLDGEERVASDRLRAIDAALSRLHAGSYGICVNCGEPIGDGRLVAIPEAATCIACATRNAPRHR